MGFLGRMMAEHADNGGYMKCENCGKRSTHRKIEYNSYTRILTLQCPNRLGKIMAILAALFLFNISGYTQDRPKVRNRGGGFDIGIGPYSGDIEGLAFRIGGIANFYSNRVPVFQNFGLMNLQFGPGFSMNYGYRFGISPLEGTLLRLKPYIDLGPSLGILFMDGEAITMNGNLGAGFGFKYFYNNTSALNLAVRIEAMTNIFKPEDWGVVQIMLCFAILRF
jgi:hypothetical protein